MHEKKYFLGKQCLQLQAAIPPTKRISRNSKFSYRVNSAAPKKQPVRIIPRPYILRKIHSTPRPDPENNKKPRLSRNNWLDNLPNVG